MNDKSDTFLHFCNRFTSYVVTLSCVNLTSIDKIVLKTFCEFYYLSRTLICRKNRMTPIKNDIHITDCSTDK